MGTVVVFLGVVELTLWAAGVRPLIDERDPFRGFAAGMRVYELDPTGTRYRTRPRAMKHSFGYQEFAAEKPRDGYRVFVLGGSSAFGFPWGPGVAFTRLLGVGLQQSRPGRSIETINAGAMSYGSHRLRILVDELLEYEPDALVLYTGHNEFVEARFYDDLLERSAGMDRARTWFYRSRLVSALTRAWERLGANGPAGPEDLDPAEASAAELLGLDVTREQTADVSNAQREDARRRFEENLRAILQRAEQANVRVVLCTVPSNVGGWKPNQSAFSSNVDAAGQAAVVESMARAEHALAQGDAAAALAALEPARRIDPAHAGLQFLAGRAYRSLGRLDEARTALLSARDQDATPSRAIGALNDTVRRLAAETGALLVDVERAFEARSPGGIVGYDWIEDYVHPTPEGHWLAALELWRAFEREGLVGQPSEPDEEAFRAAVGDPEALAAAAAEATPNPSLLFNLGVVLENQGRLDAAMDRYRECLRLDPRFWAARFNMARLLTRSGRHDEAIAAHRETLRDQSEHVPSWIGLGEALRQSGRAAEAVEALEEATRLDPSSADAWTRLGLALSTQGRNEAAVPALQEAIGLEPESAPAHAALGFVQLYLGRLGDARSSFETVLRLDPGAADGRNGLAAIATEEGRFDEAERLFRESLRINPADGFARGGLELLGRRRAAGGGP